MYHQQKYSDAVFFSLFSTVLHTVVVVVVVVFPIYNNIQCDTDEGDVP